MFVALQVKSTGEARYLATSIDDYSGLWHVVPFKYKWGMPHKQHRQIRGTIWLWETQTSNCLEAACTDRGTESINSELTSGKRVQSVASSTFYH